ncbi:hypothetical protein LSH36_601g01096 [Paralvinella palmiformis]|uniref:Major facilitator superfamily (MFS) profile domain-containing protein n=1 Tax=Paralvinella palmiformis TaxID=53620 RepID=A0AAD9MWC7_9ANNE|nr:hypothetical protein LSH36_601g01096 [Paralvinella palmiformis]
MLSAGVLTEDQASWFQCLLFAGAVVGGLAASSLIHLLGRKGSILMAGIPFLSGWLCLIVAKTHVPLYSGRFLVGMGYGMVEVVCPVYVAETVSDERLTTATMWLILGDTSGTLIQYGLGMCLTTGTLCAISTLPVVGMMIGMIFMPESPRWLIHTGQKLRALKSIQWLRMVSKNAAKNEFAEINANASCQSVCYSETFQEMPKVLRPLAACAGLFLFQQFSGITPLMFNAEWILKRASSGTVLGHPSFNCGQLSAVVLAATRVVMTVCGLPLVDRLGKRRLFVINGALMTASLSTFSFCLYFKHEEHDALAWVPLVSLMAFVSAYSVAWSSVPRSVISEISSQKVKGLASGIGATGAWLSCFVVTQQFLTWYRHMDLYGLFLLYGFFCLAGSLTPAALPGCFCYGKRNRETPRSIQVTDSGMNWQQLTITNTQIVLLISMGNQEQLG